MQSGGLWKQDELGAGIGMGVLESGEVDSGRERAAGLVAAVPGKGGRDEGMNGEREEEGADRATGDVGQGQGRGRGGVQDEPDA